MQTFLQLIQRYFWLTEWWWWEKLVLEVLGLSMTPGPPPPPPTAVCDLRQILSLWPQVSLLRNEGIAQSRASHKGQPLAVSGYSPMPSSLGDIFHLRGEIVACDCTFWSWIAHSSAVSGLLQCPLATLSSVEFPADFILLSPFTFFLSLYISFLFWQFILNSLFFIAM